ncbi:MAG: diacylglycerol kinase [Xanthomonadales bacterium]
MKAGHSGVARLLHATRWSIRGLRACWSHEAAFRQEVLLLAVLLPASLLLARDTVQWLLLILPVLALLTVELINSAIEAVVDRIGNEFNELSGRAKDLGSAAVFICLLAVALSWLVIAYQNLFRGGN